MKNWLKNSMLFKILLKMGFAVILGLTTFLVLYILVSLFAIFYPLSLYLVGGMIFGYFFATLTMRKSG